MYIIHQFLVLYKCHKLKDFIFRFSSLFSILSSNLPAHYLCPRGRTLLISLGLDQSPVLCEAPFTCPHCSSWGRLPEVSQPQGNRSQSQTSLPLFWQKCVYFLSANYVESKCPPLCCPSQFSFEFVSFVLQMSHFSKNAQLSVFN